MAVITYCGSVGYLCCLKSPGWSSEHNAQVLGTSVASSHLVVLRAYCGGVGYFCCLKSPGCTQSILWKCWVLLLPEATRLYSEHTVEVWVPLLPKVTRLELSMLWKCWAPLLPEATQLYSEHTVEVLGTSVV